MMWSGQLDRESLPGSSVASQWTYYSGWQRATDWAKLKMGQTAHPGVGAETELPLQGLWEARKSLLP